jgi:hypothetical protein
MGGGMPGGKGGGGAQPSQQTAPLVIQQTENEMHISNTVKGMDGKDIPMAEHYKLDGKEVVAMVPVPNSPNQVKITTKATSKKSKLQIRQTTISPQGNSESKKEYTMSKDGKTLTLEIMTTMLTFQSIQKLVYNRR